MQISTPGDQETSSTLEVLQHEQFTLLQLHSIPIVSKLLTSRVFTIQVITILVIQSHTRQARFSSQAVRLLSLASTKSSVAMNYQRSRDPSEYNRPSTQRFLTPRGWAVRLPNGRIIYADPMGGQRGPFRPTGRFPSTAQLPRQFPVPLNGFPGSFSGELPSSFSSGFMSQFQGQYPGQFIGGTSGFQGQFPGQFPGQVAIQHPSQSSSQTSSQFPEMVIAQSSGGQFPGVFISGGSGSSPGMYISRTPGRPPAVLINPYPGQVLGRTPGQENGWPEPQAPKPPQRFRNSPVRVKMADLREDETECPICYRDYYAGDSQNEAEDAVRIVCGHVYGKKCLNKWIQENDTCPTCRGKLDLVDDN